MILAGDIGGTKTRLALYERDGARLKRGDKEQYVSADYASLEEIIKKFLTGKEVKIEKACFGVPGPVIRGTIKVTNLPWFLSEKDLSAKLGIPKVKLVNDVSAAAAYIPHLGPNDFVTIKEGPALEEDGTAILVAPGTGLGQSVLKMENGKAYVIPSEGGHANFAPSNETEIELLKYLTQKFSHVSVEHLISGTGLGNIYDFLRDTGYAEEPQELREAMAKEAPGPVITKNADKYEICKKTLDMYAHMLGSHCGNYMLTVLATGGVYLGGGVPPKIIATLQNGTLTKAFVEKGKLKGTVEKVGIYIVKDDHAALNGTAYIADAL